MLPCPQRRLTSYNKLATTFITMSYQAFRDPTEVFLRNWTTVAQSCDCPPNCLLALPPAALKPNARFNRQTPITTIYRDPCKFSLLLLEIPCEMTSQVALEPYTDLALSE